MGPNSSLTLSADDPPAVDCHPPSDDASSSCALEPEDLADREWPDHLNVAGDPADAEAEGVVGVNMMQLSAGHHEAQAIRSRHYQQQLGSLRTRMEFLAQRQSEDLNYVRHELSEMRRDVAYHNALLCELFQRVRMPHPQGVAGVVSPQAEAPPGLRSEMDVSYEALTPAFSGNPAAEPLGSAPLMVTPPQLALVRPERNNGGMEFYMSLCLTWL